MTNFTKVYLYPSRSQNEFLALNQGALEKLGYSVKKVNKAFLLDLLSMKKDAIVVLNWVEDRVYGRTYRTVFQYFLKMIALIIFSKLFAKQVVWVRHNFKPHNGSSTNFRYKFLCGLFKLCGIPPTPLEEYYSKPSLVHPLYKNDHKLKLDIVYAKKSIDSRSHLVVFFGAVKRYKNLHEILDTWPKDVSLKIAGKSSDIEYTNFLNEKINKRDLRVEWENKFLSDEELNQILSNAKFVLLPHADSTMISSGSFYHAIGEGCNIITNESRFGRTKSNLHSFVSIYDSTSISLSYLNQICLKRESVMQEAMDNYGELRVINAWQKILMPKDVIKVGDESEYK
ncbi:hypothetical protein NQT74_01340 [Alteromonas stellipolaris]|uniref:hypothetical protein n=1 Tax=Alteromonas stellipolaris TaxID=233316 RepID=UPI0021179FE7|nr:hypothetical protein [Alteromonas stellipolaris]MCQ8847223.1 hypothetical protein [Alteromonas stellipolaris]